MKNKERIRENLTSVPGPEYWKDKADEGWRPVAIEWERETPSTPDATGWTRREVPYGLRVSEDCHYLEDDPAEKDTLKRMLALIVGDQPLSKVAEELNRQGRQTRDGADWTQVTVFNMLPRLIEAAPEFLSAEEWTTSKKRILRAV